MSDVKQSDVRFRGRPLSELTRDELVEALMQALNRLNELDPPSPYAAFGGMNILKDRVGEP